MRRFPLIAFFCPLLVSSAALADVPTYTTYTLQLRSDLAENGLQGTFNVPPDYFVGDGSPALADDGTVAVTFASAPATQGLAVWRGRNGKGSIVYTAPIVADEEGGDDTNLSEPAVLPGGKLAFVLTGQTAPANDAIWLFDEAAAVFSRQPLGADDWDALHLAANGTVSARASLGSGHVYSTIAANGASAATVVGEAGVTPESGVTSLLSPASNDAGQFAATVLVPHGQASVSQLRLYAAAGTFTIIGRTHDEDATSQFSSFDAPAPAINAAGHVAFLASHVDGTRGLYLWDGATVRLLEREGAHELKTLEFFSPSLNDADQVAFRALKVDATDPAHDRRAVWVTDGSTLRAVATERDLLPSDHGNLYLGRPLDGDDAGPAFAGGPKINARGDVVFVAELKDPASDQVSYGQGVYVASGTPGDAGASSSSSSSSSGSSSSSSASGGSSSSSSSSSGGSSSGHASSSSGSDENRASSGGEASSEDGGGCSAHGTPVGVSALWLVGLAALVRTTRRRP